MPDQTGTRRPGMGSGATTRSSAGTRPTIAAPTGPQEDARRVVIVAQDPAGLAAILDAVADLAPPRAADRVRHLADQLAHADDPEAQAALVAANADRLAATWLLVMDARRRDQQRADRFVRRCLRRWEQTVDPITGKPYRLPENARGSLRGVWNAGLTYPDVRDLIDDATDPARDLRTRWRWLMGCCWRVIREARAEAEQLAGLEVVVERGDDG